MSPEERKLLALQRQLKTLYFGVGDIVRHKGTNKAGFITYISKEPDECDWQGESPKFIYVSFTDDDGDWFHPKTLKKVKSPV